MKMTLDAFRLSNEYLGIMRFDCIGFFLFFVNQLEELVCL